MKSISAIHLAITENIRRIYLWNARPISWYASGGMGASITVTYKHLLFSCPSSRRLCTVKWWVGYAVILAFPSCLLPSCALGVLAPPLVTSLGATFHFLLNWLWRRDALGLSKPVFWFIFNLSSYPAHALFVLGVVGQGRPGQST